MNCVVAFYTIDGLYQAYAEIGEKIGKQSEANTLQQILSETIATIEERAADASKPRVLFIRSHQPLYVAGSQTYEDDVIQIAGGVNAITKSMVRYPQYNIEEVLKLDPEIIIDATFYDTPNEQQLVAIKEFWSRVSDISAIKNSRLYIINTDIHSVPGPRTPQLLKVMAHIIHPEIFSSETDITQRITINHE